MASSRTLGLPKQDLIITAAPIVDVDYDLQPLVAVERIVVSHYFCLLIFPAGRCGWVLVNVYGRCEGSEGRWKAVRMWNWKTERQDCSRVIDRLRTTGVVTREVDYFQKTEHCSVRITCISPM